MKVIGKTSTNITVQQLSSDDNFRSVVMTRRSDGRQVGQEGFYIDDVDADKAPSSWHIIQRRSAAS